MNSMMSSMMSTDMFFSMPEDTKLFEAQYDIKAGNWPKEYNECVLVLSGNGNMSDFMLYILGIRDYAELDELVEKFRNEEEVEAPENKEAYSYEQILGTTFKLINAYDCYEYDEEFTIGEIKSENDTYMKQVVANGEDLKNCWNCPTKSRSVVLSAFY